MPVSEYVFDLSGRIVMSSRNYNTEWNGGFRGASLSQGTYYYWIEFGSLNQWRALLFFYEITDPSSSF